MTYSFLNFEGKQIIMRKKMFKTKNRITRVENALDLRPKDREFESFSIWYFFSKGVVSVSIHHVKIENVCSFVYSFFLTFVKFFKTLTEKKLWCQKKFLRRKVENSILIKERFSKLNFYISERMHRISYFCTLTTM